MTTDLENAVAIAKDLIAFPTTPDQPTTDIVAYAENLFQQHGVPYEKAMLQGGRHGVLLARIGPAVAGGAVLSGHMDVVPVEGQDWQSDPFKAEICDGKLYGRGSCDMKGFIACALSLIPFWQQAGLTKPIYIGLTADEETDCETINDAIALMHPINRPKIAILGEPSDMNIISSHKGTGEYALKIRGRPVHSSRTDLGLNAINVANDIMNFVGALEEELKATTRDESHLPPYTTVCVAKMQGGNAVNTVPEHCCLWWHARHILNKDADSIQARFDVFLAEEIRKKYAGVEVGYSRTFLPALEPRCDNPALALLQRVMPDAEITTAPFSTEAGFYQAAKVEAVVCGPGSIEVAHRADEYVPLAELQQCLDMLKALATPEMQTLL